MEISELEISELEISELDLHYSVDIPCDRDLVDTFASVTDRRACRKKIGF